MTTNSSNSPLPPAPPPPAFLEVPGNLVHEFRVHRWHNPDTDCEFPFLATPDDRSALLAIGNYGLCFDLELLPETAHWLSTDFAATEQRFSLDLSMVRYLLDRTFPGGALFGLIKFDRDLGITQLQLSLQRQDIVSTGPEYVVHQLGDYHRWYREPERRASVTMTERAMLDVCCSTFESLAAEVPHLLTALPPPRYRQQKP